MSWGIRITLVYVGFVILIVSMVVISSTSKSDLVAKDYYAQELNYQQRIEAISNEQALVKSISHELNSDALILDLSQIDAGVDFQGEVLLYRPSDASKDVKIKLAADTNGKQRIDKSKLSKGIYKMCVTWTNNKRQFYKEETIFI